MYKIFQIIFIIFMTNQCPAEMVFSFFGVQFLFYSWLKLKVGLTPHLHPQGLAASVPFALVQHADESYWFL